jgi:hypothetical protein
MQSIYGLLPIFVRNVKSYFSKLYGEDDFAKAAVSATLKRDRIWPGEGYGEGTILDLHPPIKYDER